VVADITLRSLHLGLRVTGIIFNPSARGEKAHHFRDHLAELGAGVRILPTTGPGDARLLARQLAVEGIETITAAGGDGTVNEVLNGVADAPEGLTRCRIAVIPLGTVNVFAKEIGIPERLDRAWSVIRAGHERTIDLPLAKFTIAHGRREQRHFMLLAGAGLAARAIERVDWKLKKRFGPLAYLWAGVQAMRPPRPEVQVRIKEECLAGPLVEIGGGEFYGGRFVFFPGAKLDDGLLEVTLLPRLNWGVLARVFFRVISRRLRTTPEVILRRTAELTLTAPKPMPFHLDGDVVGELPATLSVRPRALRVVVP